MKMIYPISSCPRWETTAKDFDSWNAQLSMFSSSRFNDGARSAKKIWSDLSAAVYHKYRAHLPLPKKTIAYAENTSNIVFSLEWTMPGYKLIIIDVFDYGIQKVGDCPIITYFKNFYPTDHATLYTERGNIVAKAIKNFEIFAEY